MNEKKVIGYRHWLRFLWKGHLCNSLLLPREKRRAKRELAYADFKMEYLKKYVPYVKSLKKEDYIKNSPVPATNDCAYSLWLQGENEAPFLVKQCFHSIRKFFDKNFKVFDGVEIWDFVTIPDFIREKWETKKIVAPNFSDIVRISLLYEHGGYWFDATDFMTSPVPQIIKDSPFFLFVTSDNFLPAMFIQSCFMRSFQNNPLMGMWRDLIYKYWEQEEFSIDYFLVHKLLKLLVTYNSDAKELFDEMPKYEMDPTHILWHKIGNLPFDKDLYEQMCKEAFFQKCSYKHQKKGRGVNDIIPGSFADYIINGKIN